MGRIVTCRATDIAGEDLIKTDCRSLLVNYPDRFVIGSDTYVTPRWDEHVDLIEDLSRAGLDQSCRAQCTMQSGNTNAKRGCFSTANEAANGMSMEIIHNATVVTVDADDTILGDWRGCYRRQQDALRQDQSAAVPEQHANGQPYRWRQFRCDARFCQRP